MKISFLDLMIEMQEGSLLLILLKFCDALQRIHKQSLQLANTNDGEGPELFRNGHEGATSSHAESLVATLAEHRQHLDSIQVLINQLKDVAPTIQSSISQLSEEVNNISSNLPPAMNFRSNSPIQAQSNGRTLESGADEVAEITSRLSPVQIENASGSSPALKLPPLFSSTPASSGKGVNMQKRENMAQVNPTETITDKKFLEKPPSNHHTDNPIHDDDVFSLQNLKRSVREAALSSKTGNSESSQDSRSNDGSEHYFVPLSGTGLSRHGQDNKINSLKSRQLFPSQANSSLLQTHAKDNNTGRRYRGIADIMNDLDSFDEFDGGNSFLSAAGSNSSVSDARRSFYDMDDVDDQIFSPPLMMDSTLSADLYEDLLAPLSETEAALMEH